MASRRFAVVLGVLVIATTCGGCAAFQSPSPNGDDASDADDPDPEALFESALVYSENLEDVSGELRYEATDGNESLSDVERFYERPYLHQWTETVESSDPEQEGLIYVANESVHWWYDPNDDRASYFENDEPHDNEETRSDRAEMADERRESYDLAYRGTEQVADRETHVLDVEAKDEVVEQGISMRVGDVEYVYALETVDPSAELEIVEHTIWIDAEYDYPLKEEVVFEGPNGERRTITEEFETVTFNDDLEDDLFAFEPPANATVEES